MDLFYFQCFPQVLFKFFVDVDDPSEKIEEKADKLLKGMTDFADELVGVM